MMKIVLAADSAGAPLMNALEPWLAERPDVKATNLSDVGPDGERYAEMVDRVAAGLVSGQYERGIMICGTGIGVCMSANKIPGIRAAHVHDTYSAERAALSNNAQIITMGARVIGPELAKAIVAAWLAVRFDPAGRSAGNVDAIDALDFKYGQRPAQVV